MIELINVAKLKPCTSSSYSPWSGVNDGICGTKDPSNKFNFHTDKDEKPWWMIDLLCSYPVEIIHIKNRKGKAFEKNLSLILIEISCDKKKWITIDKKLYCFDEENSISVQLESKITTRYVKFSLIEKDSFYLDEVFIYSRSELALEAEKEFTAHNPKKTPIYSNEFIKISVLGTSNSIMRNGYSHALSTEKTELIKNVSLGSSHSTVIPQQLIKLDEIEFDVLIVDISVNELRAISRSKELYNLNISESIYNYILCWCHRKNVIPIFLILPTNINNFDHRIITEFYEKLCKDNNQFFFNGYDYLNNLSKFTNRCFESFFNDSLHLNQLTASTLGRHLSQKISGIFDRKLTPKLKIIEQKINYFDCKFIKPSNFIEKITRKTSLVEEDLIVLNKFDTAEIKFDEDFILAGVSLNMTQTNGVLKINGKKTAFKSLENNFYNEEKSLVLVNWQIVNTIESDNSIVKLSIEKPTLNDDIEFNDHLNIRTVKDFDNPKLELYGATILLKKSRSGMFNCYHGEPLSLHDITSYKDFYSLLRDRLNNT